MNKKMMYSNGGNEVTQETEDKANKLVKKRTRIREKRKKIESKDKKTKLGKWIKKKRLKLLTRKEEKVQTKINKNPSAQKWRRDAKNKNRAKGMAFLQKGRRDINKKRTGGFRNDSWIEQPRVTLFEE